MQITRMQSDQTKNLLLNFSGPFSLFSRPRGTQQDGLVAEHVPISREDVVLACSEISSWPGYVRTPLRQLAGLAKETGVSGLYYKDESGRFGLGSFKALGGAYAVLRLLQSKINSQVGTVPSSADLRTGKYRELTRKLTVTTATDGNHGRSVAWGAQLFGCQSVIYVPRQCSRPRKLAIEAYGARVEQTNVGYDETLRECSRKASQNGWVVVSDSSWDGYEAIPGIVQAGYTVISTELLEQIPSSAIPTHIFVQGGVGSLAAAVFGHLCLQGGWQRSQFTIVEPEGAACLYASARAGKPSPAQGEVHSIMAGLCCGEPSLLAWKIIERVADHFVTIPDKVVAHGMKLLALAPFGDIPIVSGESAVAGLASFLCVVQSEKARRQLGLTPDSRVLVFGTEGDTDPEIYTNIVGQTAEDVRKLACCHPLLIEQPSFDA